VIGLLTSQEFALVETLHAAITGRARLKIKELYRCDSFKDHIERRLGVDPAIISASASTLTSTVLLHYDSGATLGHIRSLVEKAVSEFNQSYEPDIRQRSGKPDIADQRAQQDRFQHHPPSAAPHPASRVDGLSPGILPAVPPPSIRHPASGTPYPTCERPWHAIGAQAVVAVWGGSAEAGLTSEAAGEKLAAFGPNRFPEAPRRSKLQIFFNQLASLPVALLGVAAGISVLTGSVVDAVAIMTVVAINASIGFVTEDKAEGTISSLKTLMHPSAVVVRDGARRRIDSRNLVPGDLMIFEPGTYVSADCRVIEAARLRVDESSLTGESLPVLKEAEVIEEADIPIADRKNSLYMGTLVTGGQGRGIVVATGRFTEIGKLQAMIGQTAAPLTPMERQLNTIGSQMVWLSGALCGLVFITGVLRRTALALISKTTISLAVAAVPEGLPTVATTTLALGIRKLNAQRVIIRDLEAVETLGEVQTICFDKTGTVTQNRMSVMRVFSGKHITELKPDGFFRGDRKISPSKSPELSQLAKICILCGEVSGQDADKGSSTEKALLEFAVSAGLSIAKVNERYPKISTRFRAEDRNFMSTVHAVGTAERFMAVKGNPVEVLAMCDTQLVRGRKLPFGEQDLSQIEIENERMAADALRVLGFAYKSAKDEEVLDELSGLTWVGLIGMADPLRHGMKELVARFHSAGIDTIMLTGDQSATAYAIGKALGLSREMPIEILDSTSLTNIDSGALRALSQRVHVFARVSPAHKLQIVQALQGAGKIVAMTGDGINDGPALKAADIGIAMGHSGTDVARQVADVVLQDDNLETMILAVGHGRAIHDNIKKSLHFLLSTNFSEIIVMFVAGAVGIGYPLSAMQLLWINLISDIFPSLALALEAPEPGILERPPRDPKEPIIGRSDFKRIGTEAGVISLATLGAYGAALARYGIGPKASTIAFQSLTFAQLLHAISCRSPEVSIYDKEKLPPNRYLTMALGGSLGLQLLTFVIPGLRSLLGLAPISLVDGAIIAVSAILPLLVNEATKGEGKGANAENNGADLKTS
jgi:Ca2+-transporting ATPase